MKNFIMNIKIFILLLFCLATIVLSCNKEALVSPPAVQSDQSSSIGKSGGASQASGDVMGATQISGLGSYPDADECNSPLGEGAAFAIKMTGDLTGCLYAFIDEYECSPSGTYREQGRELFIGTYQGEYGTFETGYKFEGKYEECIGGSAAGAEIFGRCQHPIVDGSGTGVFNGVTGRVDFKDDIEAGNFPFRGHLKF